MGDQINVSEKSSISLPIVIGLLSSVLSIGITYGILTGDIKDHEKRITKLEQVDPQVLVTKMDYMAKQIEVINSNNDKILNAIQHPDK
jgi:hypothetical protein